MAAQRQADEEKRTTVPIFRVFLNFQGFVLAVHACFWT
jgi:hypothetical protein